MLNDFRGHRHKHYNIARRIINIYALKEFIEVFCQINSFIMALSMIFCSKIPLWLAHLDKKL